jgi:hypothetical protein
MEASLLQCLLSTIARFCHDAYHLPILSLSPEVVASAFGCIVADELNKVKQTSLNGQGPHVDGPNDEASGEGDMLWQYDTMALPLPLPAELADVDYEELMLVMEHANLQAKLQIQSTIKNFLQERT